MKAPNQNQELTKSSSMRGVRAAMGCVIVALALAGCMQATYPVASAPGSGDLDAIAYGEPQSSHPSYPTASTGSGGAIAALRKSLASSPRDVYAATPAAEAYAAAPAPAHDGPYHLDAGDKLRVLVYGQEGLTNTYAIDAGGSITMPLIGAVAARGKTPAGLAADISARLRNGYIREPSVAVEVETCRPFFILGEIAAPGQYPYVPNMSVESAVAIAGGFSPRAKRDSVTLTHKASRSVVPLGTPIGPGDTVLVGERWF
jgi:polysaccharide export outer membrane protein